MECSGLFISAPPMTFLAVLMVLFTREPLFLHASFASSSRSSSQQHHGEQSLVQVEEPSATLATIYSCRLVLLALASSSCWMRIA
jgi:hypothetical protein